jgi:hypothetical protein
MQQYQSFVFSEIFTLTGAAIFIIVRILKPKEAPLRFHLYFQTKDAREAGGPEVLAGCYGPLTFFGVSVF